MDKAIVTTLLIICGMVASLAIFNGLFPAITQSSSAVASASSRLSERIESRIEIIQVSADGAQVNAWVKNIGTVTIDNISRSDIFLTSDNDTYRVTYGGSTTPYWVYQIEGSDTEWSQAATIKITMNLVSSLSSGTYILNVAIPNGISKKTTFGVP